MDKDDKIRLLGEQIEKIWQMYNDKVAEADRQQTRMQTEISECHKIIKRLLIELKKDKLVKFYHEYTGHISDYHQRRRDLIRTIHEAERANASAIPYLVAKEELRNMQWECTDWWKERLGYIFPESLVPRRFLPTPYEIESYLSEQKQIILD